MLSHQIWYNNMPGCISVNPALKHQGSLPNFPVNVSSQGSAVTYSTFLLDLLSSSLELVALDSSNSNSCRKNYNVKTEL